MNSELASKMKRSIALLREASSQSKIHSMLCDFLEEDIHEMQRVGSGLTKREETPSEAPPASFFERPLPLGFYGSDGKKPTYDDIAAYGASIQTQCTIRELLTRILHYFQLNQKELAQFLNVHPSTISRAIVHKRYYVTLRQAMTEAFGGFENGSR